jgi:hypothetical protein
MIDSAYLLFLYRLQQCARPTLAQLVCFGHPKLYRVFTCQDVALPMQIDLYEIAHRGVDENRYGLGEAGKKEYT